MPALGQSNSWKTFDCPETQRRWRLLSDRRIEIEDQGAPTRAWPKQVDDWADVIASKSRKYAIPAYWIAAIMALETGGRPGLCLRNVDGSCNAREGMGLMAMLLSSASSLAGRPVSEQELLGDYDLQIDLGAKLIARLRDQYADDYVKVAIGYNAGSVRCGNGSTFNIPKEPCPPTPWGVVMGCLRSPSASNPYCAPSQIELGKFACPVDYPQVAIETHNAAIIHGYTEHGLGTPPVIEPPGPEPPPTAQSSVGGTLAPLLLGGAAGFYAAARLPRWLELMHQRPKKRRRRR